MRVISGTAGFVALIAAAFLSGCSGAWPANMPATTYSGIVVDGATHRPEPNATVTATRLNSRWMFYLAPVDPSTQDLGSVVTGPDGRFILKTSEGYAETLRAEHRHLFGFLTPDKKDQKDIVLRLNP